MDNSFEKLINRVLDTRYKIENVVGIGGMAYVLKAIDLHMDNRPVAIKILNQEFNSDENAVKRFVNESEAVAMVDSPNIVKIYDVAISENLKYIVMEFVDGITLKDYIDKVGALGWKEAVHYVRQILKALSHAHEKGIIHRDVKPQNVMLLRDGTVKVTDFGIAKTPTSEPLTMTDKAIGTVNYISPEQASGGKVDEKSDLYSVGVMLYEMLTGQLPFKADSPVAVAMMQVSEEPKSPRDINSQIPVGLEQIVIKSMSKDPNDRFNCAASMEKALEYFVKNPHVVFSGVAVNTGTTEEARNSRREKDKKEKLENSIRRHRSMFPIVLGITLSFFTVIIFSLTFLWNSFWMEYEKNLRENDSAYEKGVQNIENLGFIDKVVVFIDNLLGVEGNSNENREIVIKDYVGKEYTPELRLELEEMGFVVIENRMIKESDKPFNQILKQDPKGGTEKISPKSGGKIELTFYINNFTKKVYTIPECRGFGVEKAKAKIKRELSDLFITDEMIEVVEEYNDEEEIGNVFKVLPEVGSEIDTDDIPEKITLYVSNGDEPIEKIMPGISGYTKEQVKQTLEALSIKYTMEEEFSEAVEVGKVVRTNVEAGQTFMSDEEIIVYFSKGKNPDADVEYEMPNCVGMTATEAKNYISASLKIPQSSIQTIEALSQGVEYGKVYKTTPKSGTIIYNPSGEKIAIYVSKDSESTNVMMPDVVYEMHENARNKLFKAGFKNVTEEYVIRNEPVGMIVNSNYTVGAILNPDTPIILYVSKGNISGENVDNTPGSDGSNFSDLLGEGGY